MKKKYKASLSVDKDNLFVPDRTKHIKEVIGVGVPDCSMKNTRFYSGHKVVIVEEDLTVGGK